MEYNSKPTGKPADYYILGLVIAGGALWSLTYFQKSLTALFQLCAVIMFGIAMYLFVRYRLTVFRMRIEVRHGALTSLDTAMPEELDFVAERVQGKKTVPLARLSLDRLRRAEVVRYDKLRDASGNASLYKYHVDMSPTEGGLLVFSDDSGDVALFCELSTDMLVYLKRIAAECGNV